MGWRGILAGALGLAALQVVTANAGAAGKVGGLLSGVGDLARRFMSPGVPAFAKPAPKSGAKPFTPDIDPKTGKPYPISYPNPSSIAGGVKLL